MKVKSGPKYDECPKCKSAAMVMGMKTGNINVYGCLKCKNAQGAHLKMRDAKAAWKTYVDRAHAESKPRPSEPAADEMVYAEEHYVYSTPEECFKQHGDDCAIVDLVPAERLKVAEARIADLGEQLQAAYDVLNNDKSYLAITEPLRKERDAALARVGELENEMRWWKCTPCQTLIAENARLREALEKLNATQPTYTPGPDIDSDAAVFHGLESKE